MQVDALFRACDRRVDQFPRGQRAVFVGQQHEDVVELAALRAVDRERPGRAVIGELADGETLERRAFAQRLEIRRAVAGGVGVQDAHGAVA
ncbi:MAG TPA: hypothetical protein PKN08_02180 [Opitutaceae bacterium]|nr:hypothetical protein [Opitutaceae bacterium]